jgi:hypothetical protein
LFDFSFEVVDNIDEMKIMIAEEVNNFKHKIQAGQTDGIALPSVPKPAEP